MLQVIREKLPLSAKCHHYTSTESMPAHLHKYFYQRHVLFRDYDELPYRLTDDAWFGMTADPIAQQIAHEVAEGVDRRRDVLVDPFAGVGGNLIAFAETHRWKTIIAVERDRDTLACAQENARIRGCASFGDQPDSEGSSSSSSSAGDDPTVTASGVPIYRKTNIVWVLGDSMEFVRLLFEDPCRLPAGVKQYLPFAEKSIVRSPLRSSPPPPHAQRPSDEGVPVTDCTLSPKELSVYQGVLAQRLYIFASPPWGGPEYTTQSVLDLVRDLQPYSLVELHRAYRYVEYGLFLPRNSDVRQIAALAHQVYADVTPDVRQCRIQDQAKAMVVYMPAPEYRRTGQPST